MSLSKEINQIFDDEIWDIPESWSWEHISAISEVVGGGTPNTSILGNFGKDIAWITPADMSAHKEIFISVGARSLSVSGYENSGAKKIPKGSVLFSTRAPIGYVAIAANELTTSQGFKSFIPDLGISSKYMYYWLTSAKHFAEKLASGTTFLEISGKNAALLPIPVAPEKEQVRIVKKLEELLSDLDQGVAELKTAQEKLTQYRQTLLKSAVKGELTKEWREENAQKITETGEQLLARILKERRARWEKQKLEEFASKGKNPSKDWQKKYSEPVVPDTSGLPELPEGWVWASLGQCFKVEVGATPSRKQLSYWGGDIPWASSGEVQFCRISNTKETITEEGLKNSSTQINPKGSVLLGMIGEGKTRGQAAILDIDAANNQNCAALWVTETQICSEYVFFWLWSRYDETRRAGSGNSQPALNKSLVERMPIAICSIAEMNLIGKTLSEEFEESKNKIDDILQSILTTESQRKNILQEAFSGQLVEQNINDEPASILLERIKAERESREKQSNLKKPNKKLNAMKSFDADMLKEWVVKNENDRFTFDDLEVDLHVEYELLKDALFDLLSDPNPSITQYFDKSSGKMFFKRTKK